MIDRYNVVKDLVAKRPRDTLALIFRDREIFFGQLADEAETVSRAISARVGVSGEVPRIGLLGSDSADYVRLALGIALAGACFVPVPREMPAYERAALLDSTGTNAVIVSDVAAEFGGQWTMQPLPAHRLDRPAFVAIRKTCPAFAASAQFSVTNPVFVRFTSGTTGRRKGVVLSHETLRGRVEQANRALGITAEDRVLWILPMAYHFAASIMLYLWHGATTIICPTHLASAVSEHAVRHRATVIYASPFEYRMLVASPDRGAWPSLRLAVSTATALDARTANAFERRFGVPITQALGIIEAGIPCINRRSARDRPESIGHAADGFEVRAASPRAAGSDGAVEGELLVRGAGIFDAYLDPWNPRDMVLHDGWFCTGDLVRIESGGLITLLGRTKSVINIGGMKCFPEEIEAVLVRHPQVSAARVFGENNAKCGQIPVAEIVAAEPENPPKPGELVSFCRRFLSVYKIPLEFKLVEFIPTTGNGKVRR